MRAKVINMLTVLAAVALLVLLAFYVRVGVTADTVAVLKTYGMTCGSCSSKITAALQSLKGVAATEVDVEGGWVVVGYDSKTVKPEALAAEVNGAGFVSNIDRILTPSEFKQITGRDIGQKTVTGGGCCGKGGCASGKKS